MSHTGMKGDVRPWMTAALGLLAASALAGPAAADDERFEASASASLSYGGNLRQEVPIQSTPAGAEVHNAYFSAGAEASVPVVGGEASASALVPAARTDGLPYATAAGAQSGMVYSFHIDGVNTGERIPVAILGGASVNWTDFATGEAGVYLAGESGDTSFFRQWLATSTGTQSGGVNHKADEILFMLPGVSYDVQLYAKVFAPADYAGLNGQSAYVVAVADPVFKVVGDYADRYTVVGLPQPDSPVGGVPEPGVWALMLLGFAGIGAALRRTGTPAAAARALRQDALA